MQQDVLRLDVAVDHIVAMGIVQRTGDRLRDLKALVDRELLFPVELLPEGFALDIRHHVIQERIGFPRIVKRQDVRMLQVGGHLDLVQEAFGAEHGGQLGVQHLDGDLAVVLDVVREVDGGHAAGAEFALDAIAVREGGCQHLSRE